jgi:hypothetical protein
MTGEPIPYKKTELTPNLGANDSSDDIRGGMGLEGIDDLAKFVEEGGTLITEGSTAALMSEYGLATGISVEHPAQLAAKGTILRGLITDNKSPLTYGYSGKEMPIYFSQDPVLAAGGGAFGAFGGRNAGNYGQDVTPNAVPVHISPWTSDENIPIEDHTAKVEESRRRGGGGFGGGRRGGGAEEIRPRIVMQFPANPNDLLLSGMLSGGQALSNRVLAADVSLGKGHVVMFALRPFWRWQTQGTYFLGFNAILNWNDLDAGKSRGAAHEPTESQ